MANYFQIAIIKKNKYDNAYKNKQKQKQFVELFYIERLNSIILVFAQTAKLTIIIFKIKWIKFCQDIIITIMKNLGTYFVDKSVTEESLINVTRLAQYNSCLEL